MMLLIIKCWQEKLDDLLCYRYLRRVMRTLWLLLSYFPRTDNSHRTQRLCRDAPTAVTSSGIASRQKVSDSLSAMSRMFSHSKTLRRKRWWGASRQKHVSLSFFLGDCLLFWADVRKKLVCVRQSSAKCQTEQQNKQRCGKNTATLLTRSDKYQLFFQKIILLSLPFSFFSLEERIKTSTECLNLIIHQKTNMRMICLFFAALITRGSVYATCKLKAAAQSGWWCRIHAVTWRCRLLLQPADKTGYFQAHVGIFSCLLLLKWTLCLWRQKELKHVFWLGCLWDK